MTKPGDTQTRSHRRATGEIIEKRLNYSGWTETKCVGQMEKEWKEKGRNTVRGEMEETLQEESNGEVWKSKCKGTFGLREW